MTNLKKVLAILLCIAMLCVLGACAKTPDTTDPAGTNGGNNGGESEAPAYVTGPVTIEYWHNHGGDLGVWMTEKVKEFNETNKYGITVIETNQGGYGDILSKLKSSYGTAVNCNMAIVGAGGIEELAGADVTGIPTIPHQGAFADLAAYVERDNFDLKNIPEGLRYYMEHYEGKVIEFPFLVSTTVIYYNKAFYTEEPKTLEEWVSMAKKITQDNPGVYGMSLPMDMGFIQRPIVKSLGAPGLCTADGEGPAAELLGEKSVLRTFLTDYRGWIEDGYCYPLNVSAAAGVSYRNAFMNGDLAAFVNSSAAMTGIIADGKAAVIEVVVCSSVGYGCQTAGLGGGGFAVMSDCTQQEAAACWEFMKFLLSDENQIEKHKVSGYLPFSYTATSNEDLKTFWAENPGFEVAFKTQDVATYNDWSLHLAEWRTEVANVFQAVLIDGSLTVDDAIKQLERQAPVIFAD